jgi:hypothetical protein
MATNTSDFFTFSKTAGTAKNLQKPTDGGDNNLWGGYINVDLDTIVGAVNATSDLIADANQNELVDFTATGSAVNHVGITNAATGNGPTIEAKGDDTNIDLNVSGKGTGKLATTSPKITTGINDSNNNELIKVTATGSAVNEITVANAATGNGPTLSATGDDTNINLNIAGKGTGEIEFASNIAFSNDTDAKVKLPSGGGIYESDGSTEILTESSGAVTLKNTTIDSTVSLTGVTATQSEVTGSKKDSSITSGTSTLTIASASGISNGDFVVGEGITPGTTVSSGAGTTTLTLSANANATLSNDPVMFYSATKLLSPGLVGGMLCRAWVNFDGTGTVAIRASANVSSITDIADGKYTVNFTTAMEDANYCVTGAVRKNNTTDDGNMVLTLGASDTTYSTTGFRVTTRQSASNGVRNAELVCCAVFR